MTVANQGDTVKIHYTARIFGGKVFDKTEEPNPYKFVIGEDKLLSGIEESVVGMSPGEQKTITLTPDEAFGKTRNDLEFTIKKNDVPSDIQIDIGQTLMVSVNNGKRIKASVTEIGEEMITLDANHPLAGQTITVDIQLVDIL